MKQIMIIGMVLLMAACGRQTAKTGGDDSTQTKKEPMVTARDAAKEKLEAITTLRDSLAQLYEQAAREEQEQAAFVMENATKLADDAPEVQNLNDLRKRKMDLQNQLGLADGQIKLLKRDLKME